MCKVVMHILHAAVHVYLETKADNYWKVNYIAFEKQTQ